MKIKQLLTIGLVALVAAACTDEWDEMENTQPSWLGENVYDYLQGRGDCDYYVRLIDDAGLTEVMQRTGSNTLFFTRDEKFDEYFAQNKAKGVGPTSYDEMSTTLKNMFISLGRISNAQLIERLSYGDVSGTVLRRGTYYNVTDSVPVCAKADLVNTFYGNSYFQALPSDTILFLQDASDITLTQFFPLVEQELGITSYDLDFIYGGEITSSDASIYDNKIITEDITCKNGYLHELDGLILPPETMAGFINSDERTTKFSELMSRFAIPLIYKSATATTEAIYTLRYFNEHPQNKSNSSKTNLTGWLTVDEDGNDWSNSCLYFDPAWNAYQSSAATSNSTEDPYQGDMGVMFVPTDQAIADFFSLDGDGADWVKSFGTWDNVPDAIVADFVKNHQIYSFLGSLPHDFDILKDEAGYDMELTEADIDDHYVARNGMVYLVNRVFPPLDYKSVMGPAKIDQANQIFNIEMNDSHTQFMYYLRSLLSCYQFFISPDATLTHYVDPVSMAKNSTLQAYWKFWQNSAGEISATIYNLNTGDSIGVQTSTSVIQNRFTDILRTHTLVVESNEAFRAAVADGQEYFVTMGYMPLRITGTDTGATVQGMGNADNGNTAVTVTDCSEKTNGVSYIIDGALQNTVTSTYQNLNQLFTSYGVLNLNEDSPFYQFLRLCQACDIFTKEATSSVIPMDYNISFLQQYDYTIYAPTNQLLLDAMARHYIPTPEEMEELSELGQNDSYIDSLYNVAYDRLRRFLRYHIQDNSVFIKGQKESNAEYLSETINNTTKLFYPLYVTNTGNALSVKDNIGNTANVVTAGGYYNLCGRDIKVNNPRSSSSNDDLTDATTIETYTCTVVHQLDGILNFEQPDSQWHTDLYNDLANYQSQEEE